jgi:hypothetical protein
MQAVLAVCCRKPILCLLLHGVQGHGCCWWCTTTAVAQQAKQGMALIVMLTG